MGWFGTGSSEGASSSSTAVEHTLPTRSARQECWGSRDAYYACLTSKQIIIPPGTDTNDGRGGVKMSAEDREKAKEKERRLAEARANDPCKAQREAYEGHCARSWIDYFNKRRVLEERQRLMYAQGAIPLGSGPAPGAEAR